MSFAADVFTDTDGVALSSHTASDGGSWTKHSSSDGASSIVIESNRIRPAGSANVAYYHSGAPAAADYYVEADFVVVTTPANYHLGVTGRHSTSADTYYAATVSDTSLFRLLKVIAGAETVLGSEGFTPANTHITLVMRGSAILALRDGIIRFSVTDTGISAAGKAGVLKYWDTTASTGHRLDNFAASDGVPQVLPIGTPAKVNESGNTTSLGPANASGYVAGDALFAICAQDGTGTLSTTSTGWVKLGQVTNAANTFTIAAFYKKSAAGPGSDTLDVASTTSERGTLIVQPIAGQDPATDAYMSTGASGSGNGGDPDSLNPGVGAKDFLWIAAACNGGTSIATSAPTNYFGLTGQVASTSSASSWLAFRNLNAASEDPGTFGGSFNWTAFTSAIPPASTTPAASGSSTVRGGGALAGTASKAATSVSTARGGGSLTATDRKAATGTSSTRGGGAVVSTGSKDAAPARSGTSSVSGGGRVAGTVAKATSGSSSARGGGRTSATVSKGGTGASSVTGGGLTVGTGREGAARTTGVSGGGSVSSSVRKAATGTSSVRGGGGIASSGTQLQARSGTSTVRGGGAVRTATAAVRTASSSVRGGGGTRASAFASVPRFGVSSVSSGGGARASASGARSATSRITGGGAISSSTRGGRAGASAVRGGGFVSSTPAAAGGFKIRIQAGPLRGGAYSPSTTGGVFFGPPRPRKAIIP